MEYKIDIVHHGNQTDIYIDDAEPINRRQLAEIIGLHVTSLNQAFATRNKERQETWVSDKMWMKEHGCDYRETLFKYRGKRVLASMIVAASGCSLPAARGRGYKWQQGLISFDKMMTPVQEGYKSKSGDQRKTGKWNLKGMQPRRNVCDLQPAGILEKKYLNPKSFSASSSSGVVECGGNHFMGRTF